MSRDQIVDQILIKSGVISFVRMNRILKDTFLVAKHKNFDKDELLEILVNKCC